MATMVEFFNEEGEPPTEQTLVVTMTLESLNNRFASLGAALFGEVDVRPTREQVFQIPGALPMSG
jgi:hypothetical protein